ncbi:MAG: hypothetical protein ACRCYR_14710 [Phycicoccus sp.]
MDERADPIEQIRPRTDSASEGTGSVTELKGVVPHPERPVGIDEMNEAVAAAATMDDR